MKEHLKECQETSSRLLRAIWDILALVTRSPFLSLIKQVGNIYYCNKKLKKDMAYHICRTVCKIPIMLIEANMRTECQFYVVKKEYT